MANVFRTAEQSKDVYDTAEFSKLQLSIENSSNNKQVKKNMHQKSNNLPKVARPKVTTIGRIRNEFDTEQVKLWKDVLPKIEELIFNCLNTKYARTNKAKVQTILKDKNPLTRSSCKLVQMINVSKPKFGRQYIIADGKKYSLPGFIGTKNQEITYTSTISASKFHSEIPVSSKVSRLNELKNDSKQVSIDPKNVRKRGIMSSLQDVKIKPGPLSKKTKLNNDVHHNPDLQLVNIPSVGLEVFPRVGVKLDPTVCYHLNNARNSDGLMDPNWVSFATSVVEDRLNVSDRSSLQSHTFVLPYENNQKRILAQKDVDFIESLVSKSASRNNIPIDFSILDDELSNIGISSTDNSDDLCVKSVVEDLLKTVAISEIQDRIWKPDPDYKPVELSSSINTTTKANNSKSTRKTNAELKRLDITVINVNNETDENEKCLKEYCTFGCVCSSLQTCYMLNEHCGLPDCMFDCSCNFESHSLNNRNDKNDQFSSSVVANVQHHMNKYLAKEEQKFRRTVILSKDHTIALGACRRGSRVPKKFDDFIFCQNEEKSPKQKKDSLTEKQAIVMINRIPTQLRLEVWCMVHQLYRCYCRGIFTEGYRYQLSYTHEYADVKKQNLSEQEKLIPYKEKIIYPHKEKLITPDKKLITLDKKIITPDKKIITPDKKIITPVKKIITSDQEILLPDNENPVLVFDGPIVSSCSRTEIHSKYIVRSKKRNLKYSDRNARIKRTESDNPNLSVLLNKHIEMANALYMKTSKGKKFLDPNDIDVGENELFSINYGSPHNEANPDSSTKTNRSPTNINILKYKTKSNHSMTNIPSLLKNCSKSNLKLGAPIRNQSVIFPWKKFISDFESGKVYVWITETEPWKIYVTHTGKILSRRVCTPIVIGQNNIPFKLLNVYPPVLNEIKNLNMTAFDFIILRGHKFAWDVTGFGNKSSGHANSGSTLEVVPDTATATESKMDILPVICSVEGNYQPNNNAEIDRIISNEDLNTEIDGIISNENVNCSQDTGKPSRYLTENSLGESYMFNINDVSSNIEYSEDVNNFSKEIIISDTLQQDPLPDGTSEPEAYIQTKTDMEKEIDEHENTLPINTKANKNYSLLKDLHDRPNSHEKDINKIKVPLLQSPNNCKYRWLLLKVQNDFTELKVPGKLFEISHKNIVTAMELAESTGKTCKYPSGPLKPIPDFGIYAVPGNDLKEVFLGPYKLDDKMGLKVIPVKGYKGVHTWGSWTKALTTANIIVCNREDKSEGNDNDSSTCGNKLKNSVVFLSKPFTTLKIMQHKLIKPLNKNILSILKSSCKSVGEISSHDNEEKEKCESGMGSIIDNVLPGDNVSKQDDANSQSQTSQLSESAEDDDDVVFVPKKSVVIEIQDSDSE